MTIKPLTAVVLGGVAYYVYEKNKNPTWSPLRWLFSSPFEKHAALEAVKITSVPTPDATVALDMGMSTDQVKQVNQTLTTETDPKQIAAHAKALSDLGHGNSAKAVAAKAVAVNEAKALGATDADIHTKQVEAVEAVPNAVKTGWWDMSALQHGGAYPQEAQAEEMTGWGLEGMHNYVSPHARWDYAHLHAAPGYGSPWAADGDYWAGYDPRDRERGERGRFERGRGREHRNYEGHHGWEGRGREFWPGRERGVREELFVREPWRHRRHHRRHPEMIEEIVMPQHHRRHPEHPEMIEEVVMPQQHQPDVTTFPQQQGQPQVVVVDPHSHAVDPALMHDGAEVAVPEADAAAVDTATGWWGPEAFDPYWGISDWGWDDSPWGWAGSAWGFY